MAPTRPARMIQGMRGVAARALAVLATRGRPGRRGGASQLVTILAYAARSRGPRAAVELQLRLRLESIRKAGGQGRGEAAGRVAGLRWRKVRQHSVTYSATVAKWSGVASS